MAMWVSFFAITTPAFAHSDGAFTIHEVTQDVAPIASLRVTKDPTGGFNVHLHTSNFVWRPEMASKNHVIGEGHAHVYLDGRKIMRIYNEWFHLNTYQFATRAGEQLLSIEFVGNDHAPYAIRGVPIGIEQIVSVPSDEIQPNSAQRIETLYVLAPLLIIAFAALFLWRRRDRL
jgi:hypothetical protein